MLAYYARWPRLKVQLRSFNAKLERTVDGQSAVSEYRALAWRRRGPTRAITTLEQEIPRNASKWQPSVCQAYLGIMASVR